MPAPRQARLMIREVEESWMVTRGRFLSALKSTAGSASHLYDGDRISVSARSEAPSSFHASISPAVGFWARRLKGLGIDAFTLTRTAQSFSHAFLPGPAAEDFRQWCVLEIPGRHGMKFFWSRPARHYYPRVVELLRLARLASRTPPRELPPRLPVVFAHGTAGIVFHEVLGHPLEADIVQGTSYWKRIGQAMGPPALTVADDPSFPGLPACRRIDDEGVPASRRVLLEKGVLKDLLCDLRSSDRLILRPGSARVSAVVDPPAPRVTNTVVEADPSSPASPARLFPRYLLVAGIVCARFVPPGDVELEAGPSVLISGGREQAGLSRVLIRGKEEDFLAGLTAVGPRVEACLTFGFCAKDGRPVPVGAAAPYAAYRSLRVVTI